MNPLSLNTTFLPLWQRVSDDQLRRPTRRSAPLLPRSYDELYALLHANPSMRTELVDVGLEAWRRGRGRWFSWRGRRFHISATTYRYLVTDGRHRPLVQRWD